MKRYILAIDEGTTSARAGVYDIKTNKLISLAAVPMKQYYPQVGWVEHDAEEIWRAQKRAIFDAISSAGIDENEIKALGITNQRESVVAWDKKTGKAVSRVIVWQCRRTAERINSLSTAQKNKIFQKTGLIADAYFSASKFEWLLKNIKELNLLAKENRLCLGTIDSYISYKLTKNFVTDATNASRTMLFNIHTMDWDDELLKMFNINREWLPKVISCNEMIGETKLLGNKLTVAGMIGDQQSALFGQCCFKEGMVKNTYGTGCFMLENIGSKIKECPKNVLTTVAYKLGDKVCYAFEGSVFNAGSIVTWFKDELKIIDRSRETGPMSESLKDNGGVYFVPALTGLGSPYWDSECKGAYFGLTRGTSPKHLVRAGLESIVYSVMNVLGEMQSAGKRIKELRCDGGVTKNDFVMQMQADLTKCKISLPTTSESTLMGAVYMCGLAVGVFTSLEEISKKWGEKQSFVPKKNTSVFETYEKWKQIVEISRKWRG